MSVLEIASHLRPGIAADRAPGTTGTATRDLPALSSRPGCLPRAAAAGSGPTLWDTLRLGWRDPQTMRGPHEGAGAPAP